MNIFFNFITHLFIGAGVILLILAIGYFILRARYPTRIVIRLLSAVVGVFLYVGTKAVGFSIPELILSSIQLTSPIIFSTLAIVIPSITGVLVAWVFVNQIKKKMNFLQES